MESPPDLSMSLKVLLTFVFVSVMCFQNSSQGPMNYAKWSDLFLKKEGQYSAIGPHTQLTGTRKTFEHANSRTPIKPQASKKESYPKCESSSGSPKNHIATNLDESHTPVSSKDSLERTHTVKAKDMQVKPAPGNGECQDSWGWTPWGGTISPKASPQSYQHSTQQHLSALGELFYSESCECLRIIIA